MKLELFASTDVGKIRDHNEDNFVVCEDLASNSWKFSNDQIIDVGEKGSLLFVADGMGGTNAGEVASHVAQQTVQQKFIALSPTAVDDVAKTMTTVIIQAHESIVEKQKDDPSISGMGTTAILAWILNDTLHVAWSGDSRAYHIQKGGTPAPFTDDHSLVWDMVRRKKMTAEEARNHPESNIITQSLGDENQPPKPDYRSTRLNVGDLVILCSDGLNGMVPDEEIFRICTRGKPLPDIVRELIAEAIRQGGDDNITVIAAKVHKLDIAARPATLKSKPKFPTKTILFSIVLILAVVAFFVFRNTSDKEIVQDETLIDAKAEISNIKKEDSNPNQETPGINASKEADAPVEATVENESQPVTHPANQVTPTTDKSDAELKELAQAHTRLLNHMAKSLKEIERAEAKNEASIKALGNEGGKVLDSLNILADSLRKIKNEVSEKISAERKKYIQDSTKLRQSSNQH